MSKLPTIIVHDCFDIRGGGERLILEMANGLERENVDTTLAVGWHNPASFSKETFPRKSFDMKYPFHWREPGGVRTILMALLFTWHTRLAKQYPNRIYSGVCSVFSAPRKSKTGKNIFYCHTPPRNLYDQKALYTRRPRALWKRIIYNILHPILTESYRFFYLRSVKRMDVIVANSKNIQARVKTYLGYDSVVVYPPTDTDYFKWRGQGDYYLSTARHTPLKRVEVIAEAFRKMPDKKLIIASSGESSELVKAAAGGAPNIEFLGGWTPDEKLLDLLGNCIATIYIPIDEDFGMSPVESMAAGKPCIGVADGGLLETIVHGETGYLTPKNVQADDIIDAVNFITPEKALSMRTACETRAELFSAKRFVENMKALLS